MIALIIVLWALGTALNIYFARGYIDLTLGDLIGCFFAAPLSPMIAIYLITKDTIVVKRRDRK